MNIVKAEHQQELILASEILTSVAVDLNKRGIPLWPVSYLTPEALAHAYAFDELFLLKRDELVVGSVFLQRDDRLFWPELPKNHRSLFIHKLAICPVHQGRGLGAEALASIEKFGMSKGYGSIRLDCHSERPALRQFYESNGFTLVDTRIVQGFHCARYVLEL